MKCHDCESFDGKGCNKGPDAEEYCKGGEYELFVEAAPEAKVVPEELEELEESQTAEVFDVPSDESPKEGLSPDEIDAKAKEIEEKLIGEGMEPNMAKGTALALVGKDFAGYNGIEIPDQGVKSKTCAGCLNNSQYTGCFLGKYSECVSAGRYLFEKDPESPEGLEAEIEEVEAEEAEALVSGMLEGVDSALPVIEKPVIEKPVSEDAEGEDAESAVDKMLEDL